MAEKRKTLFVRALTADDVGTLFDIAAAVGSDEIAALTEDPAISAAVARISSGKGKNSFREVGAVAVTKVIAIVIRNYSKCEPQLKKLLASLTGTTAEEIGQSSPAYYAALLRELATTKEIRDFFTELLSFAEPKVE